MTIIISIILSLLLSSPKSEPEGVVARIEITMQGEFFSCKVTEFDGDFFGDNPDNVFHAIFDTYVYTYGYDYARAKLNILENLEKEMLLQKRGEKIRKY